MGAVMGGWVPWDNFQLNGFLFLFLFGTHYGYVHVPYQIKNKTLPVVCIFSSFKCSSTFWNPNIFSTCFNVGVRTAWGLLSISWKKMTWFNMFNCSILFLFEAGPVVQFKHFFSYFWTHWIKVSLGQCWKHGLLILLDFLISGFLFISVPQHINTPTLNAYRTLIAKPKVAGSPNSGQGSTWIMSGSTLKIKVIGQRSRSRGQKTFFFPSTLPGLTWINEDWTICPAWIQIYIDNHKVL